MTLNWYAVQHHKLGRVRLLWMTKVKFLSTLCVESVSRGRIFSVFCFLNILHVNFRHLILTLMMLNTSINEHLMLFIFLIFVI